MRSKFSKKNSSLFKTKLKTIKSLSLASVETTSDTFQKFYPIIFFTAWPELVKKNREIWNKFLQEKREKIGIREKCSRSRNSSLISRKESPCRVVRWLILRSFCI